ncbi:N-acyl amino acid synthase FeeM domain-containing protein [Uliginosibacterium sp. H1]|uniref:N-acyl amino acid synthase FeeM domain-containing protein n=1 Tax=Uliginosibacterium sp. H1 TaxID=3114757 RepID=UPI002E1836F5|nr:hypothetical protein [Uliginosibacterium sp. H1]
MSTCLSCSVSSFSAGSSSRWQGFRRSLPAVAASAGNLSVDLASDDWQLQRAGELLERRYGEAGLQMWSTGEAHHLSALALIDRQAVGTLSLRCDGQDGLFADAQYGQELDALRADGARIGEFCRLAVDSCLPVVHVLSELAAVLISQVGDLTDVIMETHPRHAAFYCELLGFARLGPVRACQRVGAPAQLLHRRIATSAPAPLSQRAQALLRRLTSACQLADVAAAR